MTRVSNLWHLQTFDQERDEKIRHAHEIEQLLAGDSKLASAQSAYDTEDKDLAELRAALLDRELESKTLDAKIKEVESRLSSGRITNPKELASLERDRQMHLRNRGDLDGKMLEQMDAIERAQQKSTNSGAALKQIESAHASKVQKLERERKALAARLDELGSLVDQARASLDAQTLATYDRLRSAKGGSALARSKNDTCAACGMQIPLALVSRIEDGVELVFCPDCGRILIG
jgi:predicted  nucleic acid-binding Zn-ribbon protein